MLRREEKYLVESCHQKPLKLQDAFYTLINNYFFVYSVCPWVSFVSHEPDRSQRPGTDRWTAARICVVLTSVQAGIDTCPECTILEPVTAWPDLDVAKVGRSGPCGYNARVSVDYNQPGPHWGSQPIITYNAGDTVDVQWCLDNNGDHGGKTKQF